MALTLIAVTVARFANCVESDYPLIATIRQKKYGCVNTNEFVLKQFEIMGFTHRLCDANYLGVFAVYNDLGFDCVPFFLA